MVSEIVRVNAIKTVKKPATVRFKTKSGKTVSFKALKTLEKRVAVRIRAKRK